MQVAVLGPHKFFEIKKVKWIPIVPILDYQTAYDTLAPYFYEMDRLFDLGHHYYAKDYDLSLPYPLNKVRPFDRSERLYYDQFVWNAHIITFVPNKSESDILQRWCIKMIQGYIAVFEAELADGVVRYCLITRRSTKRAGTRFYSRGIDDQGHVANFAETEQLIFFLDFVAVHLQLRGSVPIFF